jgi:phenylalanyl-tRNA synthetase beta subunit
MATTYVNPQLNLLIDNFTWDVSKNILTTSLSKIRQATGLSRSKEQMTNILTNMDFLISGTKEKKLFKFRHHENLTNTLLYIEDKPRGLNPIYVVIQL